MVHYRLSDLFARLVSRKDDVWANGLFQELTGLEKAPFGPFSDYTTPLPGVSKVAIPHVKAYLDQWNEHTQNNKNFTDIRKLTKGTQGESDFVKVGRACYSKWQIASKYEAVLKENNCTMWEIATFYQSSTVSHLLFLPYKQ